MNYHKLLEKQVTRYLGSKEEIPEMMKEFLQVVSRTYQTFERDKMLSEHAFTISEKEYQEVLENIKEQYELRDRSIARLKETISSLVPEKMSPFNSNSDDLLGIINYLEEQVKLTKELEKQLIYAKEQAESASKAKGEFLSVMSHEIRTPLNAIIGISYIMMEEFLPEPQRENLRTLQISGENLLNLINDILDFSKIEEGKIQLSFKPTNLRQLINNIKLANRVRADESCNTIKIIFDEEIPEKVKSDDVRLGQILNNLISNAVKFTSNGFISVEVMLHKDDGEFVDIDFSVKDTGIGIAPDKQAIIFEHFSQANSDITRQFGGSGLGLSIVRNLLHLMDSEIYVDSELGRGSRFYFRLRTQKYASSGIASNDTTATPNHFDLGGIQILLVEDVEFNVIVAQKMLTRWNAQIEVAENGLKAIEKVKQRNYDIVLMDLQMPVLDGYNAARHIREFNTQTPIIALTASASTDVLEKTAAAGMNAYVSKPFKPQDLYDTISTHVRAAASGKG